MQYYFCRILFSTTLILTAAIFLLLILPLSLSSFFVFGVDPEMPSPPSPPATTTTEKPGIVPVPPPPPSASSAIDKLLGPKILPKVEEKKDPKDGDTILSSKTDDGTITVATKVDDKSTMVTKDYNKGYVLAISVYLGQPHKLKLSEDPAVARANLESIIFGDSKNEHVKYLQEQYGKEVFKGIQQGLKDAIKLEDLLGIIPQKTPNKK